MTTEHLIVFVGANDSLSSEMFKLKKRLQGVKVIAPVMKKRWVGVNSVSLKRAIQDLYSELANGSACTERARLSVWFYEPDDPTQYEEFWAAFGHCAWVEVVPRSFAHKDQQTRSFVEDRVSEVLPLLHVLSNATYGQRRSSPLTLPLRNFRSKLTKDLRLFWYNKLDEPELKKNVKSFKDRYNDLKIRSKFGYVDDSNLVFSPASNQDLHGQAHPTGSTPKSFACGRFRFGVALFPGFHFDVSALKTKTIQRELTTSTGQTRFVKGEKRKHINIFPNDHLLPEK